MAPRQPLAPIVLRSIVVLSVFLLLLHPLLAGCKSKGSEPAGQPGGGGGGTGGPSGSGTFEAIDEEVANGNITPGEGMLYKMQSIYAPPLLPTRFQGGSTFSAEPGLLDDLAEIYNGLPAADREKILPYLVPPFYAGSWWDLAQSSPGTPKQAGAPEGVAAAGVTGEILDSWSHIDTLDGHVRVWYAAAADLPHAQAAATAMAGDVWTKLTGLMGFDPDGDGSHGSRTGESERYDIIVTALEAGIFGLTKPVMGNFDFIPPCDDTATYIEISTGKTVPTVRSTVAHEFMHALQRSLSFNGCDEYRWLREATATWAQDFVYAGDDYEQTISVAGKTFPQHFLEQTDVSMDAGDGRGAYSYGAYLFFQYLSKGFSPSWIRYIWQSASASDSLGAIDAGLRAAGGTDLEKRWPQFSRFIWNRDPVAKLLEWDGLNEKPELAAPAMTAALSAGSFSDSIELDVSLPRMASQYYEIELPDTSVSGFFFVNGWTYDIQSEEWDPFQEPGLMGLRADPIPADEAKGRSVALLYLVPGAGWLEQDLTKSPTFAFCRDVAGGYVQRAVLVFANGDVDAPDTPKVPLGKKPLLWYDNVACNKWSGTARWDLPSEEGHYTVTANYTWESGAGPFGGLYFAADGDTLEELTHWVFDPVSGSMTWSTSGDDGTCSYAGNETWPVDANAIYDQLLIRNFVLEGAFERTFRALLLSIQERMVTEVVSGPPDTCPDDFTYRPSDWIEIPHGYSGAVVEPSGGRIDVRYEDPMQGSNFDLQLNAIR